MASQKRKGSSDSGQDKRTVYREFGGDPNPALERAIPELPPNQQQIRVQASRKGRGGKTVTVISGFQVKPETLANLLKQLKTQCGSGGTIREETIEIQGDHTDKLVELLMKLGYKAKKSGG